MVHALAAELAGELPEIDPGRLRSAIECVAARMAAIELGQLAAGPPPATIASEIERAEGIFRDAVHWERLIELHLDRAAAVEDSAERAEILRELADLLEHEMGDPDRALSARLVAFDEASAPADLEPLLRLAQVTGRLGELPLDAMGGLIDSSDTAGALRLGEIAAAWEQLGLTYRSADCHERVLSLSPADARAHEALELFYRATGEGPALIDLLSRRTAHVDDRERAELFREIGTVYERELGDVSSALDAYRQSDALVPDHPEVLDALSRLAVQCDATDEAVTTLVRLSRLVAEPAARARLCHRAAELAWHSLDDADTAHELLVRAHSEDPDLVAAVDALVMLRRERGELAGAVEVLIEASGRTALAAGRPRRLAEAAELCLSLGERDRAAALYREAHTADPTDGRVAAALAELCWEAHALVELAPLLEQLCRTTDDPGRRRGYLLRMAEVAGELGDAATARESLAAAIAIDPGDPELRRRLADALYQIEDWGAARALIEGFLDEREDLLPVETCVELHYRAARCARACGDDEGAGQHAAVALALVPDHRPTLLLRAELDAADPVALIADRLALASTAPPHEKAAAYAAIGDLYADRLGDPKAAREMYREALAYRPTDHLLLSKVLGLVVGHGDWSSSLDLLQRLIDSEQTPTVRARYRHVAAMIIRDELGRPVDAAAMLERALDDDPLLFAAADDLEAMLAADPERERLAAFCYRRLGEVRHHEGRPGEQLRLWDRLGELCLELGRRDDALCAFEVGLSLDPDNAGRRQRLADLYVEEPSASVDAEAVAIAHHQAVLRTSKRRVASYEALRALYRRTNQHAKAEACDQALGIIGMRAVGDRPRTASAALGPVRTVDPGAWMAINRLDVDMRLSSLFALVAPTVARARARTQPPVRDTTELLGAADGRPVARVLRRVATMLGVACPPTYLDRELAASCSVTLRAADGVLAPVLAIGRPNLGDVIDEGALAFTLARRLSDLQPERFARLLCPRAAELGQIIELAMALAAADRDASAAASLGRAARWLASSLHPIDLDRVVAIGARLRELDIDASAAALAWLDATERAADRVGLVVVGDLATCVDIIGREPIASAAKAERIVDLVWSSVTEEMFAVRARLEPAPIEAPRVTSHAPTAA